MTEETIHEIVQGGTTIALLVPALIISVRILKEQYESRIESLEKRTEECERDRGILNIQVQEIWKRLYENRQIPLDPVSDSPDESDSTGS